MRLQRAASILAPLVTLPLLTLGTAPQAESAEAPAGLSVRAAVEHPERLEFDLGRDGTRHPERILEFFQIEPGMRVADIQAGNGYYTELLSRIVGPEGRVFAVNSTITQRLYGKFLTSRLERDEFDASNVVRIDEPELESGPLTEMELPEDLDRVLLVRFYHDFGWMQVDRDAFNQTIFESLAPGGVFGIVDHHAAEGRGIDDGGTLHRVEASLVKAELEAAGFVLEAESYVLNDPTDGHDFNIFADNQARRDRTDRFVYFFRKPE